MLSHFLILVCILNMLLFFIFCQNLDCSQPYFWFFLFLLWKDFDIFRELFLSLFLFFFVIFSSRIFLYVNFINLIMIYIIHKILVLLKIKCFFSSVIGLFCIKKVIIFFHNIKWWKAQGLRKIEISKNT